MMKACFVLGGTPDDFPWGYDEEHPHCESLKETVRRQIRNMAASGISIFYTDCCQGVGIWAGEIVVELKKEYPKLKLVIGLPYKAQANRWPEEMRVRYFNLHHAADEILPCAQEYTEYCISSCYRQLIDLADSILAVYAGESFGIIAKAVVRGQHNCHPK